MKIPGYMQTNEAAEALGISTGRIRQLIANGTFASEKLGNANLIPIEAIEAYKANRPKAGWPAGKQRKTKGEGE